MNHKLTRQGYSEPEIDDFVLICDEKKHNYIQYRIVMKISENGIKALVKTKKQSKGSWFIVPMLYPLVKPETRQ